MASRNERKRRAKARDAELKLAVEQAFQVEREKERAFNVARANYVARSQDAHNERHLAYHAPAVSRSGKIVSGKFVSVQALKEPVKRKLVLNKVTGKMIERSIRPSGLKTPR